MYHGKLADKAIESLFVVTKYFQVKHHVRDMFIQYLVRLGDQAILTYFTFICD